MNLLMITGDRSLAAGKKGAFFNTLSELRRHFDRIDVICPHAPIVRYDMSLFGNVFVHPSPFPLVLQWLWIVGKGRQLVRRHGHTGMTVHEYAPVFNGVGAAVLHWLTHVPYMLEVLHVTGLPHSSGLWEWLNRFFLRQVIAWEARPARVVRVINTRETPEFLVAAGVPRSKIVYVPAFYIDFDIFRPVDVPKRYDVLFLGRMARNKGIDLFLDVLERTNLVGVAVGDGPLLSWMRTAAKKRGLKLHAPGFAQDSAGVAQYINESRLLLMPSLSEGGPRVVLEAMACGVPVVATPVGIVPDVLPPESIEEWDAAALAEKVTNILGDPVLYERLRQAGLQAVAPFERSIAIAAYAEVIKKLAP